MAEEFTICALVPVYNHEQALAQTVARITARGLPVVLVDDGSRAACRAEIERLAQAPNVSAVYRPTNGGKGMAVKTGLLKAAELGFSHALQIDADGQHDTGAIDTFVAAARARPRHLISGIPRFDASVPGHRFYARYLTHALVWVHTLSLAITDSMCGFRVYPVAAATAVNQQVRARRMDFDIEFIVRWHWRGHPLTELPVAVHYPANGVSHFHLWRDNRLITQMHTRLLLGMLWRSPVLLMRKFTPPRDAAKSHV